VIALAGQRVTRVRTVGFAGGVVLGGAGVVLGVACPGVVGALEVVRAGSPGVVGVPAKAAPGATIAARAGASVMSRPAVTI
jgi:hypothetical protein